MSAVKFRNCGIPYSRPFDAPGGGTPPLAISCSSVITPCVTATAISTNADINPAIRRMPESYTLSHKAYPALGHLQGMQPPLAVRCVTPPIPLQVIGPLKHCTPQSILGGNSM